MAASASANPPPSSIITPHETLSWATRQDKMGVKPGLGLVSGTQGQKFNNRVAYTALRVNHYDFNVFHKILNSDRVTYVSQ